MSYDLYMFDPQPGVDPMDTLERLDEEHEAAVLEPALLERNRRLAAALKTSNGAYAEAELDCDELAEQDGVFVEAARHLHRDVQLMAEGGLEIGLYDHQASITFPYWDSLDPDVLALAIDEAATIIAAETGWRLYDPQLEAFIDSGTDAEALRRAFDVGRDHLRGIVERDEEPAPMAPRRRFWKRVRGDA